MAPLDTPRRRNREANFFDVGVQGRKTGITLRPAERDEHGLEVLDGIFSSPAKSPEKAGLIGGGEQGRRSSKELPSTARKASRIPPPKSRSPVKTHLNSPAKKRPSTGPPSSVRRIPENTLTRSGPVRPNRPSSSVERLQAERIASSGGRGAASVRITPQGHVAETPGVSSPLQSHLQRSKHRGLAQSQPSHEEQEASEESMDDVQVLQNGDEQYEEELEDQGEVAEDQQDIGSPSPQPDQEPEDPASRVRFVEDDPTLELDHEQLSQSSPSPEPPPPVQSPPQAKKRGRPPKARVQQGHAEEAEAVERPTKRAKGNATQQRVLKKKGKQVTQGAVVNGAGHAKPRPRPGRGQTESDSEEDPRSTRERSHSSQPRSNWQIRHETPGEDDLVSTTRSGRTSVKPLAYWRNEKIVYQKGSKRQGTLPTIKEVVRTQEIEPDKRPKPRPKKTKSRTKGGIQTEETLEEWEEEPGILYGEVAQWDSELGAALDYDFIENQIALSTRALRTREVANSTFRYAKPLDSPFFGAGIVDVPPGGVKKTKNSRKMQLVFFVFTGRVIVNVADTEFRISKGGMWQVPRGNFYNIANDSDEPARIFFAQGNEIQQ